MIWKIHTFFFSLRGRVWKFDITIKKKLITSVTQEVNSEKRSSEDEVKIGSKGMENRREKKGEAVQQEEVTKRVSD